MSRYEHHWFGMRHPEGWHLCVDRWLYNGDGTDVETFDVFYNLPVNWVLVATTG